MMNEKKRRALGRISLALILAAFFLLTLGPGKTEAASVTYTVINTSDSSPGSLRQAINDANINPGEDTIAFNIDGSGPFTISLTAALPAITDRVLIDGYSQTGSAYSSGTTPATIMIVIDGSSATDTAHGLDFQPGSAGSTVRGLAINGFTGYGINVNADGVTVTGNHFGTNPQGTSPVANVSGGIRVTAAGVSIGGATAAERNVISGNTGSGIALAGGSDSNQVKGNYIGTDAAGAADLGNGGAGVTISGSSGNAIGGVIPGDRNVISGNQGGGVNLESGSGNILQWNHIGTNAGGTGALGNGSFGVKCVTSTGCGITGNLIWYNLGQGVLVEDGSYGINISQNSIYGNSGLGIDLTGTGNKGYGSPAFSASQYTVVDGAGTVTGTAPAGARVEVYATGPTPDTSGHGEGLTFLAAATAGGSGAFSAGVSGVSHGDRISAIAISQAGDASGEGNTSEFSANALVQGRYTITASAGDGGSITPSGTVTVNHGGSQSFTINTRDGYKIEDVVVDGTSRGAIDSCKFTNVISPHTVTASFTRDLSTWYLAEGSTDWGFECYISIINPNAEEADVALTYMTSTGAVGGPAFTMPPTSQATVFPSATLGPRDFSTRVDCVNGQSISVDRTMYWTGPAATVPEAHCATGVTAPATTWYLPEGSSDWGFECFLLIQNPNEAVANCRITWMIEGADPVMSDVSVAGNSRATYNMSDHIGARDASIQVTSDVPVIPERAMYRNDRREGHDSTGTPTAAADYFLAEGCTGFGFTTYVLVQNPQSTPTDVTIEYQAASGPVDGPVFTMPANSRKTICVNETTAIPGDDPSFSTHVHGSAPIIAERAMYWNGGDDGAQVCHDSIGLDAPHTSWYLPDGQTSEGRETWTLVQNPGAADVTIGIIYMTPDGTGNVIKTETIKAFSRESFNMAEHSSLAGRAAILVVSRTPGYRIMVERAMYWNSRGTGTDTVGGYSDVAVILQ